MWSTCYSDSRYWLENFVGQTYVPKTEHRIIPNCQLQLKGANSRSFEIQDRKLDGVSHPIEILTKRERYDSVGEYTSSCALRTCRIILYTFSKVGTYSVNTISKDNNKRTKKS